MSLEHFIQLSQRGKHPGSSGGEKMCRRIALALLAGVPSLDFEAINGIVEFIGEMERRPMTMRERLGEGDEV